MSDLSKLNDIQLQKNIDYTQKKYNNSLKSKNPKEKAKAPKYKVIINRLKQEQVRRQGQKGATAQGQNQNKKGTVVKNKRKNIVKRKLLRGVQPTYTHGKNMYISLDIHSYNFESEPKQGINTIMNTIKNHKKINFTLYVYEKDKEKIPDLIKELNKISPNNGISYGLHLNPKNSNKESIEQIEKFYGYIKTIQPINRTPTSVHEGGEFNSTILKKLASLHIPFVRSANNKKSNTPATKDAPAVKNVIAASAGKEVIDNFKTIKGAKSFDSYYTHPHQAGSSEPKYILDFFEKGVGDDK